MVHTELQHNLTENVQVKAETNFAHHDTYAHQGTENAQPDADFAQPCSSDDQTDSESDVDENFSIVDSQLMFMPISIYNLKISALLDSGSSINIMSSQLYDILSSQSSLLLSPSALGRYVVVANGDKVEIEGTSVVKIRTATGKHKIRVHIMRNTSHPLILGTDYLKSKNIVLNFVDNSVHLKNCSVKSKSSVELLSNTETVIFAKVPRSVRIGTQGVCCTNKQLTSQGLVVARCVVTVSVSNLIPVKILNTNSSVVTLPKGNIVAKFTPLDSSYQISVPCKIVDSGILKCSAAHRGKRM